MNIIQSGQGRGKGSLRTVRKGEYCGKIVEVVMVENVKEGGGR